MNASYSFSWNGLLVEVVEHSNLLQRLHLREGNNEEKSTSRQDFLGFLHEIYRKNSKIPWCILDQSSLSEFSLRTLKAAVEIPFGEVSSYGDLASQIGKPGAARAVGQALKSNPFPLLVPCHRVIRSDGQPGGFAGQSGNPLKRYLLRREKMYLHNAE